MKLKQFGFGSILALGLALSISGGTALALSPVNTDSRYIGPPIKTSTAFAQLPANITAVDATNNTFTLGYIGACPMMSDSSGKSVACTSAGSETVSPNNVLVLDKFSLIVASASQLKVGSAATVYAHIDSTGQKKAYLVRIAYSGYCYRDDRKIFPQPIPLDPVQPQNTTGNVGTTKSPISMPIDPCNEPSTPPGGTVPVNPPIPPVIEGETPTNPGNPGNSGSALGTSISAFAHDMSVGSQSDEVHALQEKLRQLGIFPKTTPSTGLFGPTTRNAVIEYQRQHNIPQTGKVGPMTRQSLEQDQ